MPRTSSLSFRNRNALVRGTTNSPSNLASVVVSSSARPSPKYSWSRPGLMSSKGSTAIEASEGTFEGPGPPSPSSLSHTAAAVPNATAANPRMIERHLRRSPDGLSPGAASCSRKTGTYPPRGSSIRIPCSLLSVAYNASSFERRRLA